MFVEQACGSWVLNWAGSTQNSLLLSQWGGSTIPNFLQTVLKFYRANWGGARFFPRNDISCPSSKCIYSFCEDSFHGIKQPSSFWGSCTMTLKCIDDVQLLSIPCAVLPESSELFGCLPLGQPWWAQPKLERERNEVKNGSGSACTRSCIVCWCPHLGPGCPLVCSRAETRGYNMYGTQDSVLTQRMNLDPSISLPSYSQTMTMMCVNLTPNHPPVCNLSAFCICHFLK